jgi:hypothetical protein
VDAPRVSAGHVAAWVGVGGHGLGPGGSDEWIQAGIADVDGGDRAAYYEVALPGAEPRAVVFRRHLAVGRRYRFTVRESRYRPGWWAAWLDGRRVTPWIHLAASHKAWRAVATAESLDDGADACNRFAFRFSSVLTRPSSDVAWRDIDARPLTSFGGRILMRTEAGFVAARTPTAGH